MYCHIMFFIILFNKYNIFFIYVIIIHYNNNINKLLTIYHFTFLLFTLLLFTNLPFYFLLDSAGREGLCGLGDGGCEWGFSSCKAYNKKAIKRLFLPIKLPPAFEAV